MGRIQSKRENKRTQEMKTSLVQYVPILDTHTYTLPSASESMPKAGQKMYLHQLTTASTNMGHRSCAVNSAQGLVP